MDHLNKTNAMRILTAAGVPYESLTYAVDEADLSGHHIARQIGFPEDQVFKTLVLHGDKTGYFVCCIPSACELDLKKAAVISGNKRAEMVAVKELLGLTGYVRGGCSPIGMKKSYPVYLEESAQLFDEITISAGVRGCVLKLSPAALIHFLQPTICDLTV